MSINVGGGELQRTKTENSCYRSGGAGGNAINAMIDWNAR